MSMTELVKGAHAHWTGDRGVRRAFFSVGLMSRAPGTVQRLVGRND